jgi:hypothetical protein
LFVDGGSLTVFITGRAKMLADILNDYCRDAMVKKIRIPGLYMQAGD